MMSPLFDFVCLDATKIQATNAADIDAVSNNNPAVVFNSCNRKSEVQQFRDNWVFNEKKR